MYLRNILRTLRTHPTLRLRVGSSRLRLQTFRMASTLPKIPLLEAIAGHEPGRTAIVHSKSGRSFAYGELLNDVAEGRDKLLATAGGRGLENQRLAFLFENGYDYVVALLSILANNAIAVPLSPGFPDSELRYILENSEAMILLSSTKYENKAKAVLESQTSKRPIFEVSAKKMGGGASGRRVDFDESVPSSGGMMLYTSGTTSRPKGVLLPQSVLTAQAQSLLEAWKYNPQDYLLHVLPLHHIHGTINALLTPLFAGSTVEFMFPFNANAVWERLAAPFHSSDGTLDQNKKPITFLTVVPTIYNRLLSSHASLSQPIQKAAKKAISPSHMRLNISGSAALPTPTKAAWTHLSGGNVLLERYGMTEVGMALSCGLDFKDRVDGSVGWPLPFVEARLVDTESGQVIGEGEEIDANGKEREGEIQLRGATIFKEYWKNQKATAEEFVEGEDGRGYWFKTGDVALRRTVEGVGKSDQAWAKGPMYFIRGRKSVDIIKTGGEKVSALEVEREILALPQIAEVAVVGIPSDQWGQKVAAIVVLEQGFAESGKGGKAWGMMDMRRALKDKLANYKIPQELKILPNGLPRNAMGKVNKKTLVKEVFPDQES